MPLFEYVCASCGKKCELLISGDEKPVCRHCGGTALEKQLSTFAAPHGTGGGHAHGGGCGCCAKRDSCSMTE